VSVCSAHAELSDTLLGSPSHSPQWSSVSRSARLLRRLALTRARPVLLNIACAPTCAPLTRRPPVPPAASAPAEQLAGSLLAVVQPSIDALAQRLLELQESQAALVEAVARNKEGQLEASAEWLAACAILERAPEYTARAQRIKKTMQATQALVAKVERGAAALRQRLEERDAERAAKKTADAAAFGSVAQR
jgi:hypothetical protein